MSDETSGHSVEEAATGILGLLESDEETPEAPSDEPGAPDDESEEPEGPDSDEEPDDEPDPDEPEDPDDDPEEPETLDDSTEIEIDGETVTLADLKKDRLRQADYTRKTMALAEERKAFQAEAGQTRAARDQYAEGLKQLQEAISKLKPSEPDWDTLRKENPAEFAAQWAEHERMERAEASLAAERQRIEQEQQAEFQEQAKAYLADQQEKLLEAIPEWKDEAKATAEKRSLVEAGEREYGFTPAEFAQVSDHRLVVMLRDALKYRELSTKGAEAIQTKKQAAKVLKPGSRDLSPNRGKKARIQEMENRLKRTGSVKDAARLFEATMPD